MLSSEIMAQSAAAAEGARLGILIGTALSTLIIAFLSVWFLTFLVSPFLATQARPSERAFKTVALATVIVTGIGLSRIGPFALLCPVSAVPVYYYRRWRYRRAWNDTDLSDTFQ